MNFTHYFKFTRERPDRKEIKLEWIEQAFHFPVKEEVQSDGRIRRWAKIEQNQKFLRIVLLDDGITFTMRFLIVHLSRRIDMDIRYFQDTDTLLLVFNQNEVVATDDLNENMLVDRDINGNPVSLTIEHAATLTNVNGLSFQQIIGDTVKDLVTI